MSLIESYTYLGGFGAWNSPVVAQVDAAEKVTANAPLPRETIAVGYPMLGYGKAPPPGDSTWWQMRRYPTCGLAYAVTAGPVFAGTRTATIRNADETAAVSTGLGVQVTQTPEEKRRKLVEDVFEDQWTDILCGLESLNFGRWLQEVIWGRAYGVTAPVRFKSFMPWEVQLQRDKFNDFAGFKLSTQLNSERDARYAFLSVCQPQFDPIYGVPRAENAREAWWGATQTHGNGDKIELKASGIQMAIGIASGMTFRDASGNTVTNEEAVQKIKNAAITGATWTYPMFAFDKSSIQGNPELAKIPAMKVDSFDWGDTGDGLLASIARLERRDVEIFLAWNRPPREALEGTHGTKAEAGVHGQVGITDSEKVHSDFLRQFNKQVVNRFLVTNFGPDAADSIYFKPEPIADAQQGFKQDVAKALLADPAQGPALAANVDGRRLLKGTEIPLLPEGGVPQGVPMPAANGTGGDELSVDDFGNDLGLSVDALALDCGTGAGGFKAGNKCQKKGDGSSDEAPVGRGNRLKSGDVFELEAGDGGTDAKAVLDNVAVGDEVKIDGTEYLVRSVKKQIRTDPVFHPTDPASTWMGEEKILVVSVVGSPLGDPLAKSKPFRFYKNVSKDVAPKAA